MCLEQKRRALQKKEAWGQTDVITGSPGRPYHACKLFLWSLCLTSVVFWPLVDVYYMWESFVSERQVTLEKWVIKPRGTRKQMSSQLTGE